MKTTSIDDKLQILREVARDFMNRDGLRQMRVLELIDELDEQIADARADAKPVALAVWYGSMPESNGKTNWTAILHRGDIASGMTIDRSEYPDRVRYEADRARWLIGELDKEPWILDYDADKHSGYVPSAAPAQSVQSATWRDAIKSYPSPDMTLAPQPSPTAMVLDDLSALVVRLVRELRKASPDHPLPVKALDYLYRKDLSPSVLRGGKFGEFAATESVEQPVEQTRALTYVQREHLFEAAQSLERSTDAYDAILAREIREILAAAQPAQTD